MPEETIRHINGIPIEGGVNDCHWVFKRKCTNPDVTRNKIRKGYSRDWKSKQNCTLSLWGTIYCDGFKFMTERQGGSLRAKMVRVKINREGGGK